MHGSSATDNLLLLPLPSSAMSISIRPSCSSSLSSVLTTLSTSTTVQLGILLGKESDCVFPFLPDLVFMSFLELLLVWVHLSLFVLLLLWMQLFCTLFTRVEEPIRLFGEFFEDWDIVLEFFSIVFAELLVEISLSTKYPSYLYLWCLQFS